jgi:hypothetical protein
MLRWPVRLVVGIGIVAASTWAQGGPVAACSCVESTDLESFDRASAVFVGEVIDDWSEPPPKSGEYSSDLPRWFTFATTAVYKGDVFDEQFVRTVTDGASCGMELGGSGPFLIFAAGSGELRSTLCDGNRAVDAAAIPDGFGAPRQPLAGASPSSRPGVDEETVDETSDQIETAARPSADREPSAVVTSETRRSRIRWVIPAGAAFVVLAGAAFTVARRPRSAE